MWLLTFRDLQHRAVRFGVVIIATSVVFALLMLMNGFANQLLNESKVAVQKLGTPYWINTIGQTGPFTSTSTLPAGAVTQVTDAGAQPVLIARSGLTDHGEHRVVIVIGHSIGGIGLPHVSKGRLPTQPDEVTVDESTKLKLGSAAQIGSHIYRVVGLVQDETVLAGIPFVFMDIAEAQRLIFNGEQVFSAILLPQRPATLPAGTEVQTAAEVAIDARRPLEKAISSINMIRVLLWIVAAMIIGGVIYLSSMERRRDFAVLKAVGSETRSLLFGLGAQSVIVALAASIIASLIQAAIAPSFPMKVHVTAVTLLQVAGLAIIVSLFAGVAGMRQAARVDPALSFSS